MAETQKQVVLRRRPEGLVVPDDVEVIDGPIPELADGEALVRNHYAGIEAAMRTWLDGAPGYLPAFELGEVIRAATVGTVVETRCDAYEVGDVVTNLGGFQEYSVSRDDLFTTVVPGETDKLDTLGLYNSTGCTAFFGMVDIGRPKEGDTVVVSAATGGVGSLAGQIAKAHGARTVGIAGGPEKCRVAVEEFGYDACIDRKAGDLEAQLKEHCPKRVDVYFDNVGGEILDAVLGRINDNARVVLCGVISSYLTGEHPGPKNYTKLLSRTASMQGFNSLHQWHRFDEAFEALRGWREAGQLDYRVHRFDGLDEGVDAINSLFLGTNIGKSILRIDPEMP